MIPVMRLVTTTMGKGTATIPTNTKHVSLPCSLLTCQEYACHNYLELYSIYPSFPAFQPYVWTVTQQQPARLCLHLNGHEVTAFPLFKDNCQFSFFWKDERLMCQSIYKPWYRSLRIRRECHVLAKSTVLWQRNHKLQKQPFQMRFWASNIQFTLLNLYKIYFNQFIFSSLSIPFLTCFPTCGQRVSPSVKYYQQKKITGEVILNISQHLMFLNGLPTSESTFRIYFVATV